MVSLVHPTPSHRQGLWLAMHSSLGPEGAGSMLWGRGVRSKGLLQGEMCADSVAGFARGQDSGSHLVLVQVPLEADPETRGHFGGHFGKHGEHGSF